MRQDYDKFRACEAEILCIGPEDRASFEYHWARGDHPYIGLPDPESRVAHLYGQEVKLLKFGRLPALFVIDKAGIIRYAHYADSMSDIPRNAQILGLLERINSEGPRAEKV